MTATSPRNRRRRWGARCHDPRLLPAEPPSSRTSGELVYTGLALILLCFFILLGSFTSVDPSRLTRFVHSFSRAVNVLSGGLKTTPGTVVLPPSEEMQALRRGYRPVMREIRRQAQAAGLLAGGVDLRMDERGVVLRLSDTVLFASGSAQIRPQAHRLMDKIGRLVRRTPYAVCIEGHTDTVPIRTERFPSNWELSTARAVTVLRTIQARGQVADDRLAARGCGSHHPLATNRTAAGRARNRRVEIIFTPRPSAGGPS